METNKKWKNFDFGPPKGPSISKQKRVNASPEKNNSVQDVACDKLSNNTSRSISKIPIYDLHENLTPKSISELAVHPKKIEEVMDWIQRHVLSPEQNLKKSSFLVISGPTGSGKTITLNLICKSMGISVSEWVNPIDQDYEIKGQNQISQFVEFLGDSKWNSLFDSDMKKITLVKDFPNVVIHRPEQFFDVLEECSYKTDSPIVFICTDSNSNSINLVRMLFPDEIMTKYNIAHISFNACASTLMKNAIKRALELIKEKTDCFKQPAPSTIDAIMASSMGDIRNTMNQLYLASLKEAGEIPTIQSLRESKGSKRKKADKGSKLKGMSKDESLGLFHGLGRVLCPKKEKVGTSWRLCHDVGKLVDEFAIQPSMFVSFLFENYLKYFGDLKDVCHASEVLSICTGLLDRWAGDQEALIPALWTAVLGLMVFNQHKVSRWNQIRGPVKFKKSTERSEDCAGLGPTDFYYYNVVTKSNKFHKFQIN